MPVVVQKFGGTSLATDKNRQQAVQHVLQAKKEGFTPVVVVSAMGRKGAPYATDTLNEVVDPEGILPSRELDLAISCGEIISSVLITQLLIGAGCPAQALTGFQAGIITNDSHENARVLSVESDRIASILERDKVPVIAGFQGTTVEREITTLGRGGSDTTAVVIGAALDAHRVEIFTDVEGMMTADPEIVSGAKKINHLSYYEACELARQGATILHPRAAEIAMEQSLTIHIRSSFSDAPGTVISSKRGRSQEFEVKSDRPITGITSRQDIVFFLLTPPDDWPEERKLCAFGVLAREGISLDYINVRSEAVSFTVNRRYRETAEELLKNRGFEVQTVPCCSVSVVGAGMTGLPGIMSEVVEALNRKSISVLQITDSHHNIACLVKESDRKLAIREIHRRFDLGGEQNKAAG